MDGGSVGRGIMKEIIQVRMSSAGVIRSVRYGRLTLRMQRIRRESAAAPSARLTVVRWMRRVKSIDVAVRRISAIRPNGGQRTVKKFSRLKIDQRENCRSFFIRKYLLLNKVYFNQTEAM